MDSPPELLNTTKQETIHTLFEVLKYCICSDQTIPENKVAYSVKDPCPPTAFSVPKKKQKVGGVKEKKKKKERKKSIC